MMGLFLVLFIFLFIYLFFFKEKKTSKICCQICIEDKEKREMFQIPGCDHSFCTICISRHVESKLQDNNISISCPAENCKNLMEPASLISVIPSDVFSRWGQKLSESTILASQKYYCPYKECSEILINDSEEGVVIRESECPYCHKLFCAQCNVPWHQGFNCKEFNRPDKDKKQMEKLAKKKKWKKCPSCTILVGKTEGCIHVTCRCKFEFCYKCGSRWNESHFNTCQT